MKEDNEIYVEGHLYSFKVSGTIKGTTESGKIKIHLYFNLEVH